MAKDYDALGEMTLRREEARLERKKAKAEAYKENAAKTLSSLLKQDMVKKSIARDFMEATRNPERHNRRGNNNIFERAVQGSYKEDEELVTGFEPRPWED